MKSGDKVLDIGSGGVDERLRPVTYLSGVHIPVITISEYHAQRAKTVRKKDRRSSRGYQPIVNFFEAEHPKLPLTDHRLILFILLKPCT